jgi:hypothetical protein
MNTNALSKSLIGLGLWATFTVGMAGCDDDDDGGALQFRVRIQNVATPLNTSGGAVSTPLSPGAFVVYRGENPLFEIDEPASAGLESLAVDGTPQALSAEAGLGEDVESSGTFGQGDLASGQAMEFIVTAKPGDRLSFALQYDVANDLFISTPEDGIPLFAPTTQLPLDGEVQDTLVLFDAGAVINEEPGLGASRAENGVVLEIQDTSDPFSYPDVEDILEVDIEPIED